MRYVKSLIFAFSGLFGAQQKLTLADCEVAFQKNNLQLLAEQYNLSMADADIVQSKIWPLPELSLQVNAYNPEDKKVFDAAHSKSVSVSQLIFLGGKKKNEIAFAKSNKELSMLQFNQLLVDLKAQLRVAFFSLYFENKKLENVQHQLGYMEELLSAYNVQVKKGNISLKDKVRLQSFVIQLNNDKIASNNEILALQKTLKVLTGIFEDITPAVESLDASQLLDLSTADDLEQIKSKAITHNADYQYAQRLIDNAKLYAQWQKSLNVPDLNLGAAWDQNGGVFRNEVNLNVGIPIPLWKSNKGNVDKANFAIQQNQKNAEFQKLDLETQVASSYNTWKNNYDQLKTITEEDIKDLHAVYNGMLKNFRNSNISLIEFTDFMDSYRETMLQLYDMRRQVILSAEQLNQLVQTKIFY
ncbi:outer membrane protein, cobalt-zinc-cadmium efflux system [Soonwooa buanensis]|uniref:Outer membrane protein, cobalt-zinc-cadmium efflux system n=1 Tax=Soonwooa buanensis TaxID=619805 RepID=A0A1T5FH26_9FLAO|nr:TolC family protein [Soonwooa buanensis]SKB95504.1 outer membrane protein, cobalt-zinc-cadmium efflux system [Soonwooa buanensis]